MRLDLFLTEQGCCKSRTRAQELIRSGAVTVDGKVITKPSYLYEGGDVSVDSSNECIYVSRGGLKLEAALNAFSVTPSELVCIDIGASTGGFTDCLLKNGAKKVYAVDSGSSQLDKTLSDDKRVVSIESFNARYMTLSDIGEKCDIAVMDVSFISQTKLYGAVSNVLKNGGTLITLIKPQFEVGPSGVGKGGIVKNEKKRKEAVDFVKETAAGYGFICLGTIVSPIMGGDGNTEYLACFKYQTI